MNLPGSFVLLPLQSPARFISFISWPSLKIQPESLTLFLASGLTSLSSNTNLPSLKIPAFDHLISSPNKIYSVLNSSNAIT